MVQRILYPLFILLSGSALAPAQTPLAKDIESLARDAVKTWRVPGLAVAVVHNDRLVFLQGFGVRELGKNAPVTPDTVFPLASCTKSFTALALGMLVDDGKLAWDDPVRKHLPYFRLADPLADRDVTVRDLLTHRTGVGSHDLLWYKSPWNLEERIKRSCRLDLKYPFRSTFEYQTVFFSAAGEAGGKAAGLSWRDLVEQRIFKPLDMKTARLTQPDIKDELQLAQPHRLDDDGRAAPYARYALVDPDPAGSIHASARDLSKYLRFQLGGGAWQGKQLLAAEHLAEPHTPQVVLRLEGAMARLNPDTVQMSYGMGWIVQDYRGQAMVLHGGIINGFRCQLTLLPKARLGIALLNNLDHTMMNYALTNHLVDLVLGLPYKDWNAIVQEALAKGEEERTAQMRAFMATRKPGTEPSLPLDKYVGRYEDSAYGPCAIRLDKGQLIWEWGKFRCPLTHFHDDVFLGTGEVLLADVPFTFRSRRGECDSLNVLERPFRRMTDKP